MTSAKALMLLVAAAICLGACGPGSDVCDGEAGEAMAQVYAVATSYPDSVPLYVMQRPELFSPDGNAIKCGRAFVSELRSAAISGPSASAVREQAMDVANRAGRPDLGPAVADDMLEARTDLMLLASHIEALVDTLPAAATGNQAPYENTLLYTAMSFSWGLAEQWLPPEEVKALRDLTMELSEWYAGELMNGMQ